MEPVYKDKAGNELRPGDAVWFDPVGGVVQITHFVPPTRGSDGADQPGMVTLEMVIPFVKDKADVTSFQFGFFLVTRNPRLEKRVESQIDDILSGKTKPSATLVMPSSTIGHEIPEKKHNRKG